MNVSLAFFIREYIIFTAPPQISEGGMRLELPTSFNVGDLIVVTFVLPVSLESIVGRAQIVHKKTNVVNGKVQTGIKFINLDPPKRRVIRDFVSSKTSNDKELVKKENGGALSS